MWWEDLHRAGHVSWLDGCAFNSFVRYVALVGQVNNGKATRLRTLGGAMLPDKMVAWCSGGMPCRWPLMWL